MDTPTSHREAVKQVLLHYAQLRSSHGQIRLEVVFDETRDHYALMQVGWQQGRRVKGNIIYVTLRNHQIVIEYDGIEQGIVQDLIAQGISKDQVVLAFLPEVGEI